MRNAYWSIAKVLGDNPAMKGKMFATPIPTSVVNYLLRVAGVIDVPVAIDGATMWQTFFRVILPLARPGLVAVALFTFLIAWNSYVWALVLTTNSSMYVLSVGIANMVGEYRVQWNELMAAAVIATAPVMAFYALLERHLVNAITAGAVKG